MLSGEEQPAEGPREPWAKNRIVGGIEERVAAARPWVVFPSGLVRRDELRVFRAEPIEAANERGHAGLCDHLLRGVARAATSQQGQNPRSAALLLVAIPERAERQRRSKRPRAAWQPPEATRELQDASSSRGRSAGARSRRAAGPAGSASSECDGAASPAARAPRSRWSVSSSFAPDGASRARFYRGGKAQPAPYSDGDDRRAVRQAPRRGGRCRRRSDTWRLGRVLVAGELINERNRATSSSGSARKNPRRPIAEVRNSSSALISSSQLETDRRAIRCRDRRVPALLGELVAADQRRELACKAVPAAHRIRATRSVRRRPRRRARSRSRCAISA